MQSFLTVLDFRRRPAPPRLLLTIAVSAAAVAAGALLGTVFGLALTYRRPNVLAFPFRVIVDVVRGTPVLVLILASYYMPAGLGVSPGPIDGRHHRAHGLLRLACRRDAARRAARHPAGPDRRGRAIGLTFGRDARLRAPAAGDPPDRAELRQYRRRDRQGVVAPLGDRRRRACS